MTNLRATICLAGLIGLGLVFPTYGESDKPTIYSSTQTYGPYSLESDRLQQMPAGFVPISFEEDVWVLGYSSIIIDAAGNEMARDLQCHTVLAGEQEDDWRGSSINGAPFPGFYSDGYTPRFVLPEGTGVLFRAGDLLHLTPMFNNRQDEAVEASMAVSVDFVKATELDRPLVRLHSTVAPLTDPFLYMVPPGGNVKEREIQFPYEGKIHAMGLHLHPYGRVFEVIDVGRNQTVWRAEGEVGDDGRLLSLPTFSSRDGYPFGPEDRFLLRATYANPTDVEQDAMAGVFIFFSTPDGDVPPHPGGRDSKSEAGDAHHGVH